MHASDRWGLGTADHLSPDEAFGMLANGTRMAILRELWEADRPLRFTRLRDGVGAPDSGNFNYHLERLVGHFVEETGDGYALREAGRSVVRSVLSGVLTADVASDPVEVAERCPYCGAPAEVRYRDEVITVTCSRCPGVVGGDPYVPGTFMHYHFPPAGLGDRTPEEVIRAAHAYYDGKLVPMMAGVCPECAGRTTVELDVCRDHEVPDDALCPHCDSRYRVWSEYACVHCGYTRRSALWFKLMNHAAVVAFYHDRGGLDAFVPLRKLTWEHARYVTAITETVVSEDPLRIRVDLPLEGEELRVTVDEAVDVVDIEGPVAVG